MNGLDDQADKLIKKVAGGRHGHQRGAAHATIVDGTDGDVKLVLDAGAAKLPHRVCHCKSGVTKLVHRARQIPLSGGRGSCHQVEADVDKAFIFSFSKGAEVHYAARPWVIRSTRPTPPVKGHTHRK